MEAYSKNVLEYSDIRDAVDCARKEGIEKVAKNLKTLHFSIDEIVKVTGLTPEQIRSL
jgi:hypothetical protein